MGYRKLNFALAVLGVLVAAAGLIAQTTLLRAYDARTESFIAADMDEAVKRLNFVQNEYRKITLQYGFNVRVLPEGQSLADFHAEGYASKTMDQNYARRLADSDLLTTIRHLAPILRQKITWTEKKRRIVLIGTHGEEPLKERKRRKKAIIKTIPEGKIDVGYDLWNSLDLKSGQSVKLLGREFEIRKCQTEQGSQDDISIWVDLKAAQEMTDKVGKINEIQAVDCKCADANPVKIRRELSKILPGAKVMVKTKPAVARAAVRVVDQQDRIKELQARKASRARLRRGREELMAVTAPLLVAGAALWISLLALGNVKQRTVEIGILRAIGLSGGKILSVFLIRSLIIGLVGAVAGVILGGALGAAVAAAWGELTEFSQVGALFSPLVIALAVICSPILSALVSWPPSVSASRQDPAVVLSRE